MILLDIKDAVREGNGETLVTIHKVLLPHFKSLPGFNAYAIEMLISVTQNKVFLSEAEAQHCMWVSTANWEAGVGKNIEIDLLQENRNKTLKRPLKQWVLTKQTRQLIGLVEPLRVKDSLSKTLTIRSVKQTLPYHTATNHLR